MTEEVKAYEMEEVYGAVQRDGKDFYVTKDRIWIELINFNPLLVRMAMNQFEMPQRPTYQVKTMGGRVETHKLDEVSAQDDPKDMARWNLYLEEKEEVLNKRSTATTKALFIAGTKFDVPNTGWEEIQEMIGITIPTKTEARKAHYLETVLEPSDLQGLLAALTKKMGVSETEVKEAEDSFRA